ncbi:MAG: hypothetical protein AUK44_05525 [Porphyromonadaceae bacterium CG2_30_38_12]|nr:MAG: hypothetical protein AUK44_05525 [Porphyromonadaceae bacterium CG2_30_38_12]
MIELVPTPSNISKNEVPRIISTSTTDYIQKEIRNKHLGLLGELFILKNEIEFLNNNGKADLAAKVQHVSVEIGDGLGYDILSFDLNGNEKKIEVKTTRSDITRPFYLTRNEIDVSILFSNNYYLYRLFDFDYSINKGKYYIIEGNLTNSLKLEALLFLAYPKTNI